MKRLNVLYLIRTWALGGSHTIIRLFLKHLPEDQFNIITVPFDAPGPGNQDFIDSLHAQRTDVAPDRVPWRTRRNWFKARDKIEELIEKYDIDLIHCHDTHSNVLVGLGRDRFKCACVTSPYGWWQPTWHLQAHLYHWVEKNLALPNFERVYTVSENMKQKVLRGRTPEDRIRVIHTGLDLTQFDTGDSRLLVRAKFSYSDRNIVIGTVSRLFKEKGHRTLLDAVKILAAEFQQIRLLIIGTGDERDSLEKHAMTCGIRDKVTFTGFYRDLPGALRAMDIFAQPSILDEGFPTAVLEAQVAGLPVVASDIGGTAETIDEGKTGLLAIPDSDTDLAETLKKLIANSELRKQMADAARPWIESSFTLDHMIKKISATYREAYDLYHGNSPNPEDHTNIESDANPENDDDENRD